MSKKIRKIQLEKSGKFALIKSSRLVVVVNVVNVRLERGPLGDLSKNLNQFIN